LVVLRSLTKFAGLAGLRLGLAFGQPPVIETLRTVQPPWSVNVMAQAAGVYVLSHDQLLPDLTALATGKAALIDGLRGLGLEPLASECNFFLVEVIELARRAGGGQAAGAFVRRELLARRCLVRDCASFGLPE